MSAATADETFEYVVVGSGAGGGPVAANLARAGKRVLLLEAGGDDQDANYEVPLFHGLATEDPRLSWRYFVHHYSDAERERRDPKYVAEEGGVLYPRAGTLGGCTAHNAMITVYPHNADWDAIARATGDRSWASRAMRRYFQRLEHWGDRRRPPAYPRNQLLATLLRLVPFADWVFGNRARHGYDGWLHNTLADPRLLLKDEELVETVAGAAEHALAADLGRGLHPLETLQHLRDPNAWQARDERSQGVWLVPVATHDGRRNGARELIRSMAAEHPDRLVVRTGALAARVLLDDGRRAVGVEYLEGRHLYRADPGADATGGGEPPRRRVGASAEVIVSAGAFNTPQLLKLSGIGPGAELREHGVDVRVDLPGVGENLQDRYEVGVVSKMSEDFTLLRGAAWRAPDEGGEPDRFYADWLRGRGPYATNGVTLAVIRRSGRTALPDLFVFGLPSYFRGYFPHYSKLIADEHDKFTWAVLKAHTVNTAGSVRLRSADPRDTPRIDFRYFDEGSDGRGDDLAAVVDGVEFARRLMGHMGERVEAEILPGPDHDTGERLRAFVADNAWGHHASCSCKMGPASDPSAVVGSDFRVHGVSGLRVVDASVFPRIPGFFIVTAVYMIAEKASDAILAAA